MLIGYFVSLAVGFYVDIQTEKRIAHVAETILPASQYSQIAHQAFKEQVEYYLQSFLMGEKRVIKTANERGEQALQYLDRILAINSLPPQTIEKTNGLRKSLSDYSQKAPPLLINYLTMIEQDKMQTPEFAATEQEIMELGKQVETFKKEFSIFVDSLQADVRNELTTVRSITRQLRYINVIAFLLVVSISLPLITILIHRSISQPLKKTFMLENAVKQSIDGIAVTDMNGNISFVNQAWERMHGYAANELLGRHLSLINPETPFFSADAEETPSNEYNTDQQTYIGETENTRKDGSRFPVLMTGNFLTDEQDRTSGLLVITKDISAQKANEAELEEARKQILEKAHQAGMAEIATGIIHNVGNVLNSVKTSAYAALELLEKSHVKGFQKANQLLKKNMDNLEEFILHNPKGKKLMEYYLAIEEGITEEQQVFKDDILRLNEKLTVIEEIITAQQNYATISPFSEILPIVDVIEAALTMQASSIDRHGLAIVRNYHIEPLLSVQKTKLIHVLINLIRNAKDAMSLTPPEEKQLTITIDGDENAVFVTLKDAGCGITEEDLGKIFTHGFTTKKNGHGFGLHSAANLMTEMGGSIQVESDGPGMGTTFVLILPTAESTDTA